jgi:tRNA-uridine 2-sulfurtransferase
MVKKPRIAMAMSGGVDSSAAAALLVDEGYEVIGFSMQLWDHRGAPAAAEGGRAFGSCCSLDDLYDARKVAAQLAIPFYVVNFEKEFRSTVVRPFIQGYLQGETPSPCVLCNTHLKFDSLLRFSQRIQAQFVATGHYARVERDADTGRFLLLKGSDPQKDQSYFLFELSQEQLARTMLPLGNLSKQEVRRLALRCGLAVAEKPESQEICFVGNGSYAAFIDRHRDEVLPEASGNTDADASGEIVTREGRVLGRHRGIHHYTVGQRRGMGIASAEPLYVVAIEPSAKRVVVGHAEDLKSSLLIARNLNWISIDALVRTERVMAKIRSRATEAWAAIHPMPDGRVRVEFDEPQRAIAPGQAIVFYQQDRVLGGGWIDRAKP